ncbi:hypothetical protein [Paraconexibacter sp.]|uniref:hypothetical protein n=1 Tax=Paraconexibacter sp. TaxID=2949640 RepID=UPI0035633862
MGYRLMGRAHAGLHHTLTRLRADAGQGTVEYVALILLVAGVLATVVVAGRKNGDAGIAKKVVDELKQAIDSVGGQDAKG